MSWPIGLLKHYTQAYFAGDYFCLKFVHFFQGELDYIIQPKDKIVFISTLHGGWRVVEFRQYSGNSVLATMFSWKKVIWTL